MYCYQFLLCSLCFIFLKSALTSAAASPILSPVPASSLHSPLLPGVTAHASAPCSSHRTSSPPAQTLSILTLLLAPWQQLRAAQEGVGPVQWFLVAQPASRHHTKPCSLWGLQFPVPNKPPGSISTHELIFSEAHNLARCQWAVVGKDISQEEAVKL